MNSLHELLTCRREVLGTWSQVAAPDLIDMIGVAGFDFTILDCEHAAFGLDIAENLMRACRASGITPLLRVPANDRHWISRALDAGATGIVVPGISSAAEAAQAVAASRFAPHGSRGACPCVRSGDHYVRDWPSYAREQEEQHGVIALVETGNGLEAIDAICAVVGLRALLIGPFDLAVSLGHAGDYGHAEVQMAIDRMIDAAWAHQLPVIMPVFSPDLAQAQAQLQVWRRRGVTRFVVGTDKILISDQFQRYRSALAQ